MFMHLLFFYASHFLFHHNAMFQSHFFVFHEYKKLLYYLHSATARKFIIRSFKQSFLDNEILFSVPIASILRFLVARKPTSGFLF